MKSYILRYSLCILFLTITIGCGLSSQISTPTIEVRKEYIYVPTNAEAQMIFSETGQCLDLTKKQRFLIGATGYVLNEDIHIQKWKLALYNNSTYELVSNLSINEVLQTPTSASGTFTLQNDIIQFDSLPSIPVRLGASTTKITMGLSTLVGTQQIVLYTVWDNKDLNGQELCP